MRRSLGIPPSDQFLRRQPTLQDVADRAGVSLATASRVLNGTGRVSNTTLTSQVTAAAAELRYISNGPAQALAHGRTTTVGVVVHDVSDAYFSSIAAGAMKVAVERGLVVMVANTFRDPAREINYLGQLRAQRARAVILAGSGFEDRVFTDQLANEVAELQRAGVGIACIGNHGVRVPTVLTDNRAGAAQVVRHLAALGHTRIGVITGPAVLRTVQDRLRGYREGLASAGLDYSQQLIDEADFTREGGRAGASRLLERVPDLTAIFGLNDLMAIGAMAALRELGVRVPEDLSVVGFDDAPPATDVVPALTTVQVFLEELGATAMDLALEQGESGARSVRRVRSKLVVRGSSGPAATS